jgi:predicted Holliday junction resolvase-like endonuclease
VRQAVAWPWRRSWEPDSSTPRTPGFLGTPLDFVVFDGLDEGDVRRVVFVEVKTGRASLASRERLCRNAIEAGRVEYQLLRLEDTSASADLGSA